MSESGEIALAIMALFLLFITARGELPAYMAVIGL